MLTPLDRGMNHWMIYHNIQQYQSRFDVINKIDSYVKKEKKSKILLGKFYAWHDDGCVLNLNSLFGFTDISVSDTDSLITLGWFRWKLNDALTCQIETGERLKLHQRSGHRFLRHDVTWVWIFHRRAQVTELR